MVIDYDVYRSPAAGQPIDYASAVAITTATTWTSGVLSPGTWTFGVRAADANGEEQNLDCSVAITIDAGGTDVSNRPGPPTGLRAVAEKAGAVRVIWSYPPGSAAARAPTGFHVYAGAGSPDYSTPAATLAAGAAIRGAYSVVLSSLAAGTAYAFAVRAYNAAGEESNTTTVQATPVSAGPLPVSGLTATLVP